MIYVTGKPKEAKKEEKKDKKEKKPTPKKEPEPAEELDAADAALAAEPKSKDPFDLMPKGLVLKQHNDRLHLDNYLLTERSILTTSSAYILTKTNPSLYLISGRNSTP